ncbi:MAG: hypothetical protein FWF51_11325 [Chitinivibrionia bacterium]|nr:hypothetical protein [Chitinivibrionia bacterium]
MDETIDVFEVEQTEDFKTEIKRFVKKKKFVNLPNQIKELIYDLQKGNFSGVMTKRIDLPIKHEIYKLRLPNKDTGEGKSGGYRIYYTVMFDNKLVLLITIYYKKEKEVVSDNFIDGLIEGYLLAQSNIEEED